MAPHFSRVVSHLPKLLHQRANLVRSFGRIKKIGIDWDQTLQDGDAQTKETLRRALEKYKIPLSRLEVVAESVRVQTKVAWGCRIAGHFIPADTHIVKSVNPSVLQTRFDPIYAALMYKTGCQRFAQTIAIDVSMSEKTLEKDVVKTILIKHGAKDMSYADIIMDFVNTGKELPLMQQIAPLEPSSVRGMCPKDLQMFMRPAYFGLLEIGFTQLEATNIAHYFTEISRETSLEVSELLPGAKETLLLLHRMNMPVFIFSNKCEILLNAEAIKLGVDKLVAGIYGSVPGMPVKPDAEMVTSVVSDTKGMAFIDDRPSGIYLAHKIGAIPFLFNSGHLSAGDIARLNPVIVVSSHDELQERFIQLETIR